MPRYATGLFLSVLQTGVPSTDVVLLLSLLGVSNPFLTVSTASMFSCLFTEDICNMYKGRPTFEGAHFPLKDLQSHINLTSPFEVQISCQI